MKVSREQAARNRVQILEAAGKLFRERGIDAVTVAEVMKAAGLTHGGFYGHFASKADLAARACASVAEGQPDTWSAVMDGADNRPLSALMALYLSEAHRDHPAQGCLYPALAGEAARMDDPALSHAFAEGLTPLIDLLAEAACREEGREEGRNAAMARLCAMVGALVLARATRQGDSALSGALLAAVRAEMGVRKP